MCGISGIIYFKQPYPNTQAIVGKMTSAMAHRGPNAEGIFVKDNVGLGHRRLSIIDLSTGANQPFSDASGRYHMVFNGEMYNYEAVKAELGNVNWRTTSDTEVLVEAWAKWGIKCVDKFKGMFSFAIWDEADKSLHIVRDRLGVKPLYFFRNDDFLIFASEIRSILASGIVPKKINQHALYDYLSFQSFPSPHAVIENIHQLEAGHYLSIKGNAVEDKTYWSITKPTVQYDYSNGEEIRKNIYNFLLKAVEQRLVSDVPIGAFLSGGIDSSAVVALMSKISSTAPATFNVSFDEKEYDESQFAEIIARKYHTDHHQISLKPTAMLDELTNALNAMDTPSGDGINTYVVSKAVKNAGITVALSGIGGDELFAGYPFFERYYRLNQKRSAWNATYPVRRLASSFLNDSSKWKQMLQTKTSEISEVYPVLRQVVSPGNIKNLFKYSADNDRVSMKQMLAHQGRDIADFPLLSQVSIADLLGYTQNTLLKDTDQMSMGVALEVREPFFDHEMIEYVLGIPDELKFPAYPKKLLVESLGDLLPPEIVHRKKQGFVMPWAHWLKKDLHAFCSERIESLCDRNWINGKALGQLWKSFNDGDTSVKWMDVWLFVVLEYWIAKNID
jgi:asparagine synthase (glutamine-hydrolysing)